MNDLPDKCVVDTNVPIVANLTTSNDQNNDIPLSCINACVEAITHVREKGVLVIDNKYEILSEYQDHLDVNRGQGVGYGFMKWVFVNLCRPEKVVQLSITKSNSSYEEFPEHDDLVSFDLSDRKFIAVANACPDTDKPPILQATDSKWWGWKDALSEVGIDVRFLCPDYVKEKYPKKIK